MPPTRSTGAPNKKPSKEYRSTLVKKAKHRKKAIAAIYGTSSVKLWVKVNEKKAKALIDLKLFVNAVFKTFAQQYNLKIFNKKKENQYKLIKADKRLFK